MIMDEAGAYKCHTKGAEMVHVVYADLLFLINFAVNYLLLLATAKISAVYVKRFKIALGALIGGVYSIAAVLIAQSLLQNIAFKIGAALLMLLVCFGREKGLLRITLIFFAVSAAFGGIVLAVSLAGGGAASDALGPVSLEILIPSIAFSYAVLTLVFKKLGRRRSGGFANVVIEHAGRRTEINSLVDTGNSLTDPISGKTVIIAEKGSVLSLFDPDIAEILRDKAGCPSEILERLSERGLMFRLLPYSAVGLERGMLLGFKPDKVIINGKDKSGTLVAISPTRLSEGGVYSAIVGSQEVEVKA